jgi:hypothetical protein
MRGKFPAAMILNILTILFLIIAICSAQSTPSFQSVSGEFAQKWIKNYTVNDPVPITSSEGNGSDLWNWGGAPRGSKIVGGKLITDPYYLRPLLNLSSNWLGEAYTDEDTGLPVETYSDPLTGKNYYNILNPNTGQILFSYYTYPDAITGKLVYAYVDPITGKEAYASSAPIDIINALAGNLNGQSNYNQNEPWTRL